MKRGTLVAVCHDGKWGRRVKGVVIDTRRGHHIKVRFPNPDDEVGGDVEFWARVRPTVRYQRRRQVSPGFFMTSLNRYKSYGGWAEVDWFCPWFAVYPWPRKEE